MVLDIIILKIISRCIAVQQYPNASTWSITLFKWLYQVHLFIFVICENWCSLVVFYQVIHAGKLARTYLVSSTFFTRNFEMFDTIWCFHGDGKVTPLKNTKQEMNYGTHYFLGFKLCYCTRIHSYCSTTKNFTLCKQKCPVHYIQGDQGPSN